jgi:hypothetical protein
MNAPLLEHPLPAHDVVHVSSAPNIVYRVEDHEAFPAKLLSPS